MTDDLSVFDLPEEGAGKDPLAAALAEAAAWQARAERLEALILEYRDSVEPLDGTDEAMYREVESLTRPSPSRLLEVVRRVLKWRILEDAMPSDREIPSEQLEEWSEVYDDLLCCPGLFTPEEKAAILGEKE